MKKTLNILYFLLVVIVLGLGIFSFTEKVDPYSIKTLKYAREMSIYDRDFLYTLINYSADNKYDYVYICGSSGTSSILSYIFENYTNKKLFTINPQGISPLEQYNLLKHFLKLHPETKNLIVSLEFNTYLNCYNSYTIPRKPSSKLNDFIRAYFSISAVMDSFKKLKMEQTKPHDTKQLYERPKLKYNKIIKYYYGEFCEFDNLAILKKIDDLAKDYKVNTIYFIPPTNALYLSNAYITGTYKHIEDYKRGLTDVVSYYDMSFINEYTKKPIRLYFEDVMHPNPLIFTDKLVDCLIYNKCSPNLEQIITKDNADYVLKSQKQLLINYINDNKDYVYKYVNFEDNIDKQKKAEKIFYLDELPPSEQKLLYSYR